MIIYINVYAPVQASEKKGITRCFTTEIQALYQRLPHCLGTYKIDTDTKEAKEITVP